jgi:hypothetical protein
MCSVYAAVGLIIGSILWNSNIINGSGNQVRNDNKRLFGAQTQHHYSPMMYLPDVLEALPYLFRHPP